MEPAPISIPICISIAGKSSCQLERYDLSDARFEELMSLRSPLTVKLIEDES
jgi:hypothetical protein